MQRRLQEWKISPEIIIFYYVPPGDRDGHASEPGGYTWRTYYTPYSTVGLNKSDQTGAEYYGQDLRQNASLAAGKEFYLAAAVMNTRIANNGSRELFGSFDRGNGLRYSQGPDRKTRSGIGVLRLVIAGNGAALTPKYSYSAVEYQASLEYSHFQMLKTMSAKLQNL